jgi:endonuclease/exonuclease/phosphatase family metal-dependent hydrolase
MVTEAAGNGAPWLRVLTLNAHQGFRAGHRHEALLRIRDALRASQADLVFLQEIGAANGVESPMHQYEVLADGVWTQYAYGRNAVATGGHHGNALLSKRPIKSWRNVDASVGEAEPRGLLHAVIGPAGDHEPLHAICLHLALRESHRRRQVGRLLELIAHDVPRDAPLVIAGDFNDWRERAHRRLVREGGVTEVHSGAAGRPARTFPARAPWLRLDRIYVRNLRHRPVKVDARDWRKLSDHMPLAAELRPCERDAGAVSTEETSPCAEIPPS